MLEGRAIHPRSTQDAQNLGISTVYQEVNLCPNLSVAENIFIGRYPRRFGMVDWRSMRTQATALLERLQIHVDVSKPMADDRLAVQ